MPNSVRKLGVVTFILAFSLVGFDDCELFGPPSNFEGLDGPRWTAVELNGVPHAGTGWFIKTGDLIASLYLDFSTPFDGSVTGTVHGRDLSGSPESGSAGGSFVYDGGSPGDLTLRFGNLTASGKVTLQGLPDGTENYRHGTIVIDQTFAGDRYQVTYSR